MKSYKELLEALEELFIEQRKIYVLADAYDLAGLPDEARRVRVQQADEVVDRALVHREYESDLEGSLRVYEEYGLREKADLARRALMHEWIERARKSQYLHDWHGDLQRALEYAKELDDQESIEELERMRDKPRRFSKASGRC